MFRYVLTNPAGVALGELQNVKAGRVGHAFNGRPFTAQATVRLDNPLADVILSGDALLKVYEGTMLRFVGSLDTFEEVGGGDVGVGSIATVWADAWWVLARRAIGKSATGYTDGTAAAQKDKSTLVANVLNAANNDGHTGLELGTVTLCGVNGYAAFAPYKDAASAIGELGVGQSNGPEVITRPSEPASVTGGTRTAYLDVLPAVGQARPVAVFEYGTGRKNVATYRRAGSNSGRAQRVYALPSSSEVGAVATVATDLAAVAAGAPTLDAVIAPAVTVPAMRQTIADEHLRLRKVTRFLITFEPVPDDPDRPGRVPRFGTAAEVQAGTADYSLGDLVTFRAVEPATGAVRVNAQLRVYAGEWATDRDPAALALTLIAD